ncbi:MULTISPECIES: hypothetical protein [Amycolatopsis]|uniref:hypothetical protein n=1 Tax=Amycolatopsis TaxID=1813 RepID=UPI0018E95115|nr:MULTISPECIES: hypothetical protein [Amycolatopsis]
MSGQYQDWTERPRPAHGGVGIALFEGIGEIGPGWEYYLDLLVAARTGAPRPEFTDYYPAVKPYESLRG